MNGLLLLAPELYRCTPGWAFLVIYWGRDMSRSKGAFGKHRQKLWANIRENLKKGKASPQYLISQSPTENYCRIGHRRPDFERFLLTSLIWHHLWEMLLLNPLRGEYIIGHCFRILPRMVTHAQPFLMMVANSSKRGSPRSGDPGNLF